MRSSPSHEVAKAHSPNASKKPTEALPLSSRPFELIRVFLKQFSKVSIVRRFASRTSDASNYFFSSSLAVFAALASLCKSRSRVVRLCISGGRGEFSSVQLVMMLGRESDRRIKSEANIPNRSPAAGVNQRLTTITTGECPFILRFFAILGKRLQPLQRQA